MNLTKRIALGIGAVILGIILWVGRERFLGIGAIMGGILSIGGITVKNKSMWYIGGVYFLVGGISSFFFPALFYASLFSETLTKIFSITVGPMFTITGIFMILQGLKLKSEDKLQTL